MSLLKSLDDKGATIAWSPMGGATASYFAAGTKEGAGGGFEEYGGDLELFDLQLNSNNPPALVGKVKTNVRFNCLAWGDIKMHAAQLPNGVLAGGMANGSVNLWDPRKIIKGENGLISAFTKHRGGVNALAFNPHPNASQLLASGSSDSDVFITDLSRPDAPQTGTPAPTEAGRHPGDITALAWNTKVTHILASSDNKGVCMIWDLRNKKPWGQVRDPNRSIYSAIAWNPAEGMHFLTATDDDMRPIIRLYDLRSSMSTPLAELNGHTQGILGISWCQHDPSLIISCGKDNRTLLWDLYSSSVVYELPSGVNPTEVHKDVSANQFFGAPSTMAGSGGTRRYDVQWSPRMPAVLSACSFDRKIQVFSLSGAGSARGPKWLKRPVGGSFGFGGKLVSFKDNKVFINKVNSGDNFVAQAEAFDKALDQEDLRGFCEYRATNAPAKVETDTWNFMKILFGTDAREQLLVHLGFDASTIQAEVSATCPPKEGEAPAPKPSASPVNGGLSPPPPFGDSNPEVSADDFFGGGAPPAGGDIFGAPADDAFGAAPTVAPPVVPVRPPSPAIPAIAALSVLAASSAPLDEAEKLIKKALMVGNFEAAVDCCISSDRLALALLIATYGGPEMWAKTQETFFKLQRRPFMNTVRSIVKGELTTLIDESSLDSWHETLAILCTYGKSEEFGALCNQLGNRLESEAKDVDAASLCYLCAMNVEKTVAIWEAKADEESKVTGSQVSLLKLVEKVSIFLRSVGPLSESALRIGDSMANRFAQYSMLLIDQGREDIANRYAKIIATMTAGKVIMDRIYHSKPHFVGDGTTPPPFPFEVAKAAPKPAPVAQPKPSPVKAPAPVASNVFGAAPANAYGAAPASAYGAAPASAYGAAPANAYGAPANNAYGAAPANAYGAPSNAYGAPATNAYGAAPANAYSAAPATGYGAPANAYGGAYGAPSQGGYGGPSTSNFAAPSVPATGGKALPSVTGEMTSSAAPIPTDGFTSSAGNPALAAKYGNAAYYPTSAPAATPAASTPAAPSTNAGPTVFNPAAAKSTAAASATSSTPSPAPGAAPATAPAAPGILPEYKAIVDFLRGMCDALEKSGVSGADAKMLGSGVEAVNNLNTRLESRLLNANACDKLKQLHQSCGANDMRTALAIVSKLTEEEWKDEKDWLKGMKFLCQLYQKRFSR